MVGVLGMLVSKGASQGGWRLPALATHHPTPARPFELHWTGAATVRTAAACLPQDKLLEAIDLDTLALVKQLLVRASIGDKRLPSHPPPSVPLPHASRACAWRRYHIAAAMLVTRTSSAWRRSSS